MTRTRLQNPGRRPSDATASRPPPIPTYPRFKRCVPDKLFYVVPALMWLALSLRHRSLTLPTAANPSLDAGGLWGESKSQVLSLLGNTAEPFLPALAIIDCGCPPGDLLPHSLEVMTKANLRFPVVGKPDRGYQGWGVRLLRSTEDLEAYLVMQPPHARVLLQELADMPGEAGVFYIRQPNESRGRIVSMAYVYPPHVIGDGRSSVAQLVAADPILHANAEIYRSRNAEVWNQVLGDDDYQCLTNARSARLGAAYRDALSRVTPHLEAVIDRISREIPLFHFGRFDIRFESEAALLEGRGFRIIEVNGAGAEMLHIWAGDGRLLDAWRCLWRQYRVLFSIGAEMRRRGHRPVGIVKMLKLQREQEKLRLVYPQSS